MRYNTNMVSLNPFVNELPSEFSVRVGNEYIQSQSLDHKKTYAQYFTPLNASHFMAGLVNCKKSVVKVADLGAGSGILGISVCETLTRINSKLKRIELTVYEIDHEMIPSLEKCLLYTKRWLAKKNIKLKITIKNLDFILENATVLPESQTFSPNNLNAKELFDVIISNPPYFKLNKSDPRAKATLKVIHGQPNIYALFMAISVHLLTEHGEMIFITPRSYTAGPYFRLFREHFFSHVEPTFIHLFGSRNKAFDKDDVLQENMIIKAERKSLRKTHPDLEQDVLISFSNDLSDLEQSQTRIVPRFEVIDMNTKNKVVRIPLNSNEDNIIKLIHAWKGSLDSYGLKISTGPVVPFRARAFIIENGNHNDAHIPLLWMQNIKPMLTKWPINTRKQQYIQFNNESKKLLVKNSNYVLLRRFSAKEENQRIVAAPYISSVIKSNMIGLENHLNYIYRPQGELSIEEVFGLAALYNCKLFDIYFRTFSGNTQVSATEIKDMPLPELRLIEKMGSLLLKSKLRYNQLDEIVKEVIAGSNYPLSL
jgi:adenine-specific DNA-methyltransferase